MSQDPKVFALDVLRREYKAFVEKVMQIPANPIPKQQAMFRLEEGHMWMQQAIIHYTPSAPAQAEPDSVAEPVEQSDQEQVAQPVEPVPPVDAA